jgi:membrane-associated phospholipid phosphatase
MRAAEWVLAVYFVYVALLTGLLGLPPRSQEIAWTLAAVILTVILILAKLKWEIVRDWFALAGTLTAYREMNLFSPERHQHKLEQIWIVWDRVLLHQAGFQRAIESLGPVVPSILELAYLLVYAIAPFALAALYISYHPERAPRLTLYYVLGTLLAYACFPFFPSEPPRTVFAGMDMPNVTTWFRTSNMFVVGGYGIHSSVFPSAHVSSAFAAAMGMVHLLPEKPWVGRGMLIYACVVSLATIYGRYHYAVDAVAGLAVGLIAAFLIRTLSTRL